MESYSEFQCNGGQYQQYRDECCQYFFICSNNLSCENGSYNSQATGECLGTQLLHIVNDVDSVDTSAWTVIGKNLLSFLTSDEYAAEKIRAVDNLRSLPSTLLHMLDFHDEIYGSQSISNEGMEKISKAAGLLFKPEINAESLYSFLKKLYKCTRNRINLLTVLYLMSSGDSQIATKSKKRDTSSKSTSTHRSISSFFIFNGIGSSICLPRMINPFVTEYQLALWIRFNKVNINDDKLTNAHLFEISDENDSGIDIYLSKQSLCVKIYEKIDESRKNENNVYIPGANFSPNKWYSVIVHHRRAQGMDMFGKDLMQVSINGNLVHSGNVPYLPKSSHVLLTKVNLCENLDGQVGGILILTPAEEHASVLNRLNEMVDAAYTSKKGLTPKYSPRDYFQPQIKSWTSPKNSIFIHYIPTFYNKHLVWDLGRSCIHGHINGDVYTWKSRGTVKDIFHRIGGMKMFFCEAERDNCVPLSLLFDIVSSFIKDSERNMREVEKESMFETIEYIISKSPKDRFLNETEALPSAVYMLWEICGASNTLQKTVLRCFLINWSHIWCYTAASVQYLAARILVKVTEKYGFYSELKINPLLTGLRLITLEASCDEKTTGLLCRVLTGIMLNESKEIGEVVRFVAACNENRVARLVLYALGDLLRKCSITRTVLEELESSCSVDITIGVSSDCVPLGMCEFLLQKCKAEGEDSDLLRAAAIRVLSAYSVQVSKLYHTVSDKMKASLKTLFGNPQQSAKLKSTPISSFCSAEELLSLRTQELFKILKNIEGGLGEYSYSALLEMSYTSSNWQPWINTHTRKSSERNKSDDQLMNHLDTYDIDAVGYGCPSAASILLQLLTSFTKEARQRSCIHVPTLLKITETKDKSCIIPWGSIQMSLLYLLSPLFSDEAEVKNRNSLVTILKLYTSLLEAAMKEDKGYRELEIVAALQWFVPSGKRIVQTLFAKVAQRVRKSKQLIRNASSSTTISTLDEFTRENSTSPQSRSSLLIVPASPPPYPLWENMAHLAFISSSLIPESFYEFFYGAITRHNPEFQPVSLNEESSNVVGSIVLAGHMLKLFERYLGEGECGSPLILTHCLVGQQGPLLHALLRLCLFLTERLEPRNICVVLNNARRLKILMSVLIYSLNQDNNIHFNASNEERKVVKGLAALAILCIIQAIDTLKKHIQSLLHSFETGNKQEISAVLISESMDTLNAHGFSSYPESAASVDYVANLLEALSLILDAFPEFGSKIKFRESLSFLLTKKNSDCLEIWELIHSELDKIDSFGSNGLIKDVIYNSAEDAVVHQTDAFAAMAERLAYRWREYRDNNRTSKADKSIPSVLIGMLQHEHSRTTAMIDAELYEKRRTSSQRWDAYHAFFDRDWSPWMQDRVVKRWRVSLHKDSMMRQMLLIPDHSPNDLTLAAYDAKNPTSAKRHDSDKPHFPPLPLPRQSSALGEISFTDKEDLPEENPTESQQENENQELVEENLSEIERIYGNMFEGEEIRSSWATTMVLPQCLLDGILLITATRLHFYSTTNPRQHGGGGGGSADHQNCSDFVEDEESYSVAVEKSIQKKNMKKEHSRTWRLERLKRVCLRRYLLSPRAAELYWLASHEVFFAFIGVKQRQHFTALLQLARTPLCIWPPSLHPRQVIKAERYTELWRHRKISNFEYLMHLNIAAGRSYNDITQYPVFPWVLGDYTSKSLDLEDSNCYRDLRKPVGALNPTRLKAFIDRYHSFEDATIPKFLYGSHYSSAGITLHYLMRQEPFASMHVALQGGHFDCPDRLFFNIAQSWRGCLNSMSDVKELVPEFFCLPEMFLNTNQLPLGNLQDNGLPIDNVLLPPWCEDGGAYEFVRTLRRALESEIVSQQLHLWIDLIFGCKQSPAAAALAADNLFYYLTYEGAVDLSSIPDATQREATEAQIAHFGQTPSQLFAEPHPPRFSKEACESSFMERPKNVELFDLSDQQSEAGMHGAVLAILHTKDSAIVVYSDMSVQKIKISLTPDDIGRPFTINQDYFLRVPTFPVAISPCMMYTNQALEANFLTIASPPSMPSLSKVSLFKSFTSKKQLSSNGVKSEKYDAGYGDDAKLTTVKEECSRMNQHCGHWQFGIRYGEGWCWLVSCGYWNMGMKIHDLERGSVEIGDVSSAMNENITCISVGEDGTMITGGTDGFLRVWILGNLSLAEALHTKESAPFSTKSTIHAAHNLYGHKADITCMSFSVSLDILFSCARDACIIVHRVQKGSFVRSLYLPKNGIPTQCDLSVHGDCVLFCNNTASLHVISLNGALLSTIHQEATLTCLSFSSDGEFVACGGKEKMLTIRKISNLSSVLQRETEASITSLRFGPKDSYLVAGCADGRTYVCVDVQMRLGRICASLEDMYV